MGRNVLVLFLVRNWICCRTQSLGEKIRVERRVASGCASTQTGDLSCIQAGKLLRIINLPALKAGMTVGVTSVAVP